MKKRLLLFTFLLFSFGLSYAQPANDACASAQAVLDDGSCNAGTNVSASDNIGGEVGCATPGNGNQHRDVFYTFTATGADLAYNITAGTLAGNIELVILSGTCASPTLVTSACGASPLTGTFTGFLTAGTSYIVVISSPSNATGTFTMCLTGSAGTPANTDCLSSTQVCNNSPFSGNSNGFGNQELGATNRGCLNTNEHQSSWYVVSIQTAGTLQMTINPAAGVDYDFALWGPASNCPPTAGPIRCSYAAGGGNTGINSVSNLPQVDASEGSGGNRWVTDLVVLAGDVYLLCIDNFTANSTAFNLNWGGTSGLSCTPVTLPIELLSFDASKINGNVLLKWITATESNNDFFTIERSADGRHFDEVVRVDGAGNSNTTLSYSATDFSPYDGVNYYRLRQTDFDGTSTVSQIIVLNNTVGNKRIVKVLNHLGQEVPENYDGIKIIYYDDGSVLRKIGN